MGIPISSMNLRVTYYSRVSTDHLEQQNSLKNQMTHFDEMIKNNPNWTYIEGYIDNGISGTTDYKRDNFMKMIDDAKNGMFDLIITKEISRFSRNTLDSIKYTRILLSYGVAVVFVNDNINTALSDSELRLTIMATIAQDEIRRLSERVKFGMNRSIINGNILGNDSLYGYKKEKERLIMIDKEASVVRRIFNLYVVDNYSINKIVKLLNNEDIKTRKGSKWCPSTLTRMIKNPKYKGYYCGRKSEVIDYMTKKVKNFSNEEWITYEDKKRIPPIISEELWNLANNRLSKRNKTFGDSYKDKIMYQNRYPLSSKIYCKNDNELFHRRKQLKSSDDISWACSNYLKNGKKECNSPIVRESEIYYIFDDIIKEFIDLSKVSNILLELYKTDFNCLIKEIINSRKIKDKLIELLLDKIVVSSKNKECIELNIYLKYSVQLDRFYEFKRGFNTVSTRRYFVNYHVLVNDYHLPLLK